MKIAFDAKRLFHNNTGLGNYSRTLVDNLSNYYPENRLVLLAANAEKSKFYSRYSSSDIINYQSFHASYWRTFSISKDINKLQPNIYHGLSNEIPFSSRKIKAIKIVTIHDLFYRKYPKDFSLIDRNIYKNKTEFACKNADHIIAISESTKLDIIDLLGVKPEKITTVYQSCHPIFQKAQVGSTTRTNNSLINKELPKEYAIFVGTLNERKNIMGLLKALKELPDSVRIPLVIVGNGKKKFVDKLHQYISTHGMESYTYFLGNIPNPDLQNLYLNARFTCLPSFYEGFGIPIIESLFSKTPVLAGNNSGLIEAVGPCGALIDPNSIENMSDSLQRLICNDQLLKAYNSKISEHIQKFTGEATSTDLNSLYSLVK